MELKNLVDECVALGGHFLLQKFDKGWTASVTNAKGNKYSTATLYVERGLAISAEQALVDLLGLVKK